MIKLNDFQKLWSNIEENVIQSVKRVGESGWYILGKEVAGFENELLHFFPGIKYAIGCGNGLDALEIGLKSLGIKKNDIVLTTPLSAFATTIAIIRAGGIPAFVDINQNGLIDLDLAEKFFEANPNAKFFMPVHLYGHSLDLKKLKKIKDKFNLKIVEDCAQSINAKSYDMSTGSVGQVAATSFYPTKNLGCFGDGGAILTSDETIYNTAKSLRDYGQTSKYHHDLIGNNSRLDEIHAAIMKDCLIPRLNDFTEKRRFIANIYIENISNPNITIPLKPEHSDSVYHLFPILIKNNRDKFKEFLKENGVESGIHYPILITDQNAMKNTPYMIYGDLKQAKSFVEQELSLPINPTITKEEALYVATVCNKWKP